MEKLTLTLTLESPYTATGAPRADLPTGEVLAWDGERWATGFLFENTAGTVSLEDDPDCGIFLMTVQRFAPLPTIIEDESTIF